MRKFLLAGLVLFTLSCAKKNANIPGTEDFSISTFATMNTTSQGYCWITFQRLDQPGSYYTLESDALVACDGVPASPFTSNGVSGYSAYFPHSSPSAVRITIVRPQAGATTVRYADLQ